MWTAAASAYRWCARRPGYMLLTASDESLSREDPARFTYAWLELMLLSLGWGIASVGVWSGAWTLFQDYGMIIVPSLATLALLVLWPLRRPLVALAELLGGNNATARAMAAALLVVGLALCLIRMKAEPVYFKLHLPGANFWLWPDWKHYRALLLMPLWGGWSSMILCQFCRPNAHTEPAVAAFARGCGPFAAAACMGLLLAGSIMYFSFLPWTQLSISASAVFAAIVGGTVLARACGGLKRKVLLVTNLLAQVALLLAYVANSG